MTRSPEELKEVTEDYKRMANGIFFPLIFILILWIVKLSEYTFEISLAQYGLFPRTPEGLAGIVLAPLIHGDINHLFSNSVPLLILGGIICYSYKDIAFRVFFWVYLMTGLWVWAAAREAYHIGASGLIYGFVSFLFFSGLFRKNKRLLALSMLVTFIYGSLVWGMLPVMPGVSWESHALGALAGLVTAYNFRREGPVRETYQWENEPEEDEENDGFIMSADSEAAENKPSDPEK